MANKSFVEYAFDVLTNSKEPITLKELFDKVLKEAQVTLSSSEYASKLSKFYTALSLDGRFILLTEDNKNVWDLRSRHTFDKYHVDMEDAYSDDDSGEPEDDEERKELKAELGEDVEEDNETVDESDDLDFDKPKAKEEDENF